MITLFCFLGLIVGSILCFVGRKQLNDIGEYEFNNRSGGGVVGFKSFKDAKKHDRAKQAASQSKQLGGALMGLCGVGFIVGLIIHAT